MAETLIQGGAQLNIQDKLGQRTALMWTIGRNALGPMTSLIEAGADMEAVDRQGANRPYDGPP